MAEALLQDVADVEIRVQCALATSPIYALREIRVEREGNALLMSGQVSSFYYKQLAQEVVRSVARDVSIVNSIVVD